MDDRESLTEQPALQWHRRVWRRVRATLHPTLPTRDVVDLLLATDTTDEARRLWVERLEAQPALLGRLLTLQGTAHRHAQPLLALATIQPPAPTFVSLGTHCFTASFLKRWGMRHWSGPFDWLFASPEMVTHCIEDDFGKFLDRREFQPVDPAERPHGALVNRVQHVFYRQQFGIEFVFNHHDVHLDDDYAYINRCVTRWRAHLAAEGRRIFVLTCARGPDFPEQAGRLAAAIRAKSGPPGARLLAIGIDPPTGNSVPTVLPLRLEADWQAYAFAPVSTWQPLNFEDLLDEHALARLLLHAAGL